MQRSCADVNSPLKGSAERTQGALLLILYSERQSIISAHAGWAREILLLCTVLTAVASVVDPEWFIGSGSDFSIVFFKLSILLRNFKFYKFGRVVLFQIHFGSGAALIRSNYFFRIWIHSTGCGPYRRQRTRRLSQKINITNNASKRLSIPLA